MKELKFRPLRADEVDIRIGTAKEGSGVSLLLYKDARCDMNILDETVGSYNWQRSHSRENANCTVAIWDEDKKQWVAKEDTGTESKTEAEKGLASDSFKRACTCWGIGRELYTAPFIWIPGATKYDKFWVKELETSAEKRITKLTVCRRNEYGDKLDAVVFAYPRKPMGRKTEPEKPKEAKPTRAENVERVKSIYKGDNLVKLLDKYGAPEISVLTNAQIEEILKRYDESRKESA